MSDELMTRAEAALLLRKPTSWLRYAERRRLIPFVRIGQHIRYMREDLVGWIRDQRVPNVAEGNAEGSDR